MISFRVSEEEFRTLKEICLGEGFGSFSDLVRTAIQELVANRAQRGPTAVAGAVQTLITRVDALDQNLKELMNKLDCDEAIKVYCSGDFDSCDRNKVEAIGR
jgi:hypothetical protein